MFIIYKGKRYMAFNPLPQPNTTYPLKTRCITASALTANTAANGCQKMPGATKSIVTKAAAKRPLIGGSVNGKTHQLF